MKKYTTFVTILFVLISFSVFNVLSPVFATPPQFDVIIKVNNKGFFDVEGNSLDNILQVPENSDVKLIFVYDAKPGDRHEIALLFSSGEEIYSDPISYENKRAHILFTSGKHGESYDVFCIIDCDAMDYLTDLVIEVAETSLSM